MSPRRACHGPCWHAPRPARHAARARPVPAWPDMPCHLCQLTCWTSALRARKHRPIRCAAHQGHAIKHTSKIGLELLQIQAVTNERDERGSRVCAQEGGEEARLHTQTPPSRQEGSFATSQQALKCARPEKQPGFRLSLAWPQQDTHLGRKRGRTARMCRRPGPSGNWLD